MGLYDNVEETYLYVTDHLSRRGLAYVHFMDQTSRGSSSIHLDFLHKLRNHFLGTLVLASSKTQDRVEQFLNDGLIDIAAFGEPFIANLDLVERLRNGCPLL